MIQVAFLLFAATRTRPRKWWRFWEQRSEADVFAWVPGDDTNEARARVHADMESQGWKVDRIRRATLVDQSFPRNDLAARWFIKRASQGFPFYEFHKPFDYGVEPLRSDEVLTSRFLDSPGVTLDAARVPENLRLLLGFTGIWAIGDDVERSRFMAAASIEDKRALVDAVSPHFKEIERFSRAHESSIPVPDEVVALNMLAEAADEASHDIGE